MTNGQTAGGTDRPSYRDPWSYLKKWIKEPKNGDKKEKEMGNGRKREIKRWVKKWEKRK